MTYASLLNKIRFNNYNTYYAGRMYNVHLLIFFFFFGRNEKGFLNFVRERIIFLKLCYRINNTRCSFQKNKLPFKLLKPQFIGRILSNLSPYLNINYCLIGRALKIYMFVYTLSSWSRWNRTHKYVRCTVRDSRIRSEMSRGSIHTKTWTLKQLHHCTQRLNHKDI